VAAAFYREAGCVRRSGVEEISKQMSITKERKQELIGSYKRKDNDTGSPEVQVALLTSRIAELTGHLKLHTKDYASRRGLLAMVSKRRRLLDYLKTVDPQRYLDIIRKLEIRK
jgi:small subunit ribosomal protein S15